ncbi:MAG: endonuclease/exonuclease/phosphatase family protein [Haliangiales bacterium]
MSDRKIITRLLVSALLRWSWIGAYGAAVATALGCLGGYWWGLDLFAHFRVHYSALLALAVAIHGVRQRWLGVAAPAIALAFNLALVAPLYWAPPQPDSGDGPREAAPLSLTVLTYNLHWDNHELARTLDYLASARGADDAAPDVIALPEIDPSWVAPVAARFPDYQLLDAGRSDSFAMAILAKPPLDEARIIADYAGSGLPAGELVVRRGDARVAVLVIHPPPPIRERFARVRDQTIAAAGAWATSRSIPSVIVGDYNATPWSYPMRALLDTEHLRSSQRGFGVQPTWPRSLALLAIPIDHVVHHSSLIARERRVGPYLGSDHRPLLVTLTRR